MAERGDRAGGGAVTQVDGTSFHALLFDLDGTLVDSAPDLRAAVNRMLAELGREGVGEAAVRDWIGNGAGRLVKRALTGSMDGEPPAAEFEVAYARFSVHYADHLCVDSRLYPGVRTVLDTLAGRGFPMGCVTNKPAAMTRPLLEALGLARYFSAVVAGDTLAEKKPDPAPLLHACALLTVEPGHCLVVGDSVNDLEAAQAAGMPAVAVSYGYNRGLDPHRFAPLAVVDRINDLVDLVAVRAPVQARSQPQSPGSLPQ